MQHPVPSNENVTASHSSAGPACESVDSSVPGASCPSTWRVPTRMQKGRLPSFLRKRKLGSIMSIVSELAVSAFPRNSSVGETRQRCRLDTHSESPVHPGRPASSTFAPKTPSQGQWPLQLELEPLCALKSIVDYYFKHSLLW